MKPNVLTQSSLCYHACNELCIEPQMSSIVLTDSSHTSGSILDFFTHYNTCAHRKHMVLHFHSDITYQSSC